MISKEQFQEQHSQLYALLEEVWEEDGQVEVFYGYAEGGKLGWYQVYSDYPEFYVSFMGETFEDALVEAKDWHREWQEENES